MARCPLNTAFGYESWSGTRAGVPAPAQQVPCSCHLPLPPSRLPYMYLSTWPAPSSGYHLPPSAGCSLPPTHCLVHCPPHSLSTVHSLFRYPVRLPVPPPMPSTAHAHLFIHPCLAHAMPGHARPGRALTTPVPPVAFIISSPRSCFCFLLPHLTLSLLFIFFLFNPFPFPLLHRIPNPPILDKPRRELVIVRRRLDSGSSREPIPFVVCLQLAAVQVASLCSHGLSAVAVTPSRSRLHPFDVHIVGGF
ncbi:hypothetical protein HDV57DRAFT_255672 [Trichoderma longibrachiatum]|uniref:Uncharacterized protein n=1 Tax=Trichoderma longibrachiatum ATCC 18648 TaxID=983965 RepID=A0A2T4C9A4_TRILO|nr:hypothetical protein M440DRAFT_1185565 [Trichoderma longibrachiatum ATCC 18648]